MFTFAQKHIWVDLDTERPREETLYMLNYASFGRRPVFLQLPRLFVVVEILADLFQVSLNKT